MKKIAISIYMVCAAFAVQAQTLTLNQCKEMAKENNYDLKNSYLEQQIATQGRKEAFTNYFPRIEAAGMYLNASKKLIELQMPNPATGGMIDMSMIKSGKTASISAMQPIFAGGQIVNGNKLAKIGEKISTLQIRLSEEEVETKAETFFWQIVQLQEKLNTLTEMESLLQSIRQDIQHAIEAGLSTKNDLLRVDLQVYELETNRLKLENGVKTSKLLLAQLIGLRGRDFDLAYTKAEETNSPLEYYVDANEAANRRPEATMLEHSIEANRLQKKMEIGKRLPSAGVGGQYLYHDLMGNDFNAALLMVNVSVPISDWWGGSHAIKKQALRVKQAENDRQNALELLAVKIEQAWNELQEGYKQILLSKQAISVAEENLRMNKQSYLAGTMTLSDLLETQTLLQESTDKYIESYTNYQLKITEYKLLTCQTSY